MGMISAKTDNPSGSVGAHRSVFEQTPISLAPGFSRVFGSATGHNRFSGLPVLLPWLAHLRAPLKRLPSLLSANTRLKPGANEMGNKPRNARSPGASRGPKVARTGSLLCQAAERNWLGCRFPQQPVFRCCAWGLVLLLIVSRFLYFDLSAALAASPTNAAERVVTYPVIGVKNIKRKLGEIVLPEVRFDGVPLSEVVKRLSEEAKRYDPERRGLNFVIFDPPQVAADPVVRGNSAPVGPPLSLGDGLIHVREPLAGLTLRHALDVICKSAEVPTQFGVEDYAVSFFLRVPGGVFGRTIRANPDTFRQGLPGVVMSPASGASVGGSSPGGVGQGQGQGQGPSISPGRAIIPAAAAATPGAAADANRLVRQLVESAGVTDLAPTGSELPAVSTPGKGSSPVRGPMSSPRLTE